MVNYNDPVAVAREFAVVVKLWHFVDGIFVWEFLTNLDYEWDVFQGHRPYGWSIWLYSFTRLATLMAVILDMFVLDTTVPINCQLWVKLQFSSAYFAFAAASVLIMLRVIAIWNRDKIVLAISMGIWMANIALLIQGIVRVRSTWSPGAVICAVLNLESTIPSTLSILFTDIVLLVTMLIGLFRMRVKGAGEPNLARFLWKQGLFWLFVVTVAGVLSSVFLISNLNAPLDLMPQIPCMIAATIAATRMHRSLINFCSSDIPHEAPGARRPGPDILVCPESIPVNRMEVSMRTDSERDRFPKSRSSYGRTRQERYKALEVKPNCDEKKGPEIV